LRKKLAELNSTGCNFCIKKWPEHAEGEQPTLFHTLNSVNISNGNCDPHANCDNNQLKVYKLLLLNFRGLLSMKKLFLNVIYNA